MAVQDIQTYSYKETFSLSVIQFEKACVVNEPKQIDAYSIYWIKRSSILSRFRKGKRSV